MFAEMKSKPFATAVALLVACAVTGCLAMTDDKTPIKGDFVIGKEEIKRYMTIVENLNVDQIVNNTRLMTNHVKCFLDEGPCTAQLKDLKKIIPLLVKDGCSSCTENQKKLIKKTVDTIKARRPNEYEKLTKLFDPEGSHQKKFLDNINESKR